MAREIETKDLILKKANIEDAEKMHNNFFSEEESAKYMLWKPTQSVKEAEQKIEKWKNNRGILFFAYLKEIDEPIGFVCIKQNMYHPSEFGDIGICVGQKFTRRGYAKQMLQAIMDYSKSLGARKFVYSYMEGNIASQKLAESFGFQYSHKKRVRKYTNRDFVEVFYQHEI